LGPGDERLQSGIVLGGGVAGEQPVPAAERHRVSARSLALLSIARKPCVA
jgi:hypothetical protein